MQVDSEPQGRPPVRAVYVRGRGRRGRRWRGRGRGRACDGGRALDFGMGEGEGDWDAMVIQEEDPPQEDVPLVEDPPQEGMPRRVIRVPRCDTDRKSTRLNSSH